MKNKDATLHLLDASNSLPNFIAANLRLLRKQAGWSQTELAEQVGLNRGNIASYESGCAEPSICKLLRISNVFQVTTRDLTRRDLSDPAELAMARSAHHDERGQSDADRYAQYRSRHTELGQLIDSSHHLFEYKRGTLAQPCKEAELLAAHYIQLLELSKQLMKEHERLLSELDCQCG